MTNTVFLTFQTQYILLFSSASRGGWDLPNTEIFHYKDVTSGSIEKQTDYNPIISMH
jgi:hypothetical protein